MAASGLMSSAVLDRARAGDAEAFRELVDPHLRELHVHCYRMLGSVTDADDVLQDTLTAAWRGLDGFAGLASLRTWLYRIATNRCLNAIRRSKRRPAAEPVPPFDPPEPTTRNEITWLQPYPTPEVGYEAREAIELAFIAALQRLPPRQAAALLLCDVLGFSIADVTAMLETSPTAVKGALQRARSAVAENRPSTTSPPTGSTQEQDLARRFATALTAGDVDGVVALLTDDAWLAMPPAPHEYVGRAPIAEFLRTSAAWRRRSGLRLAVEPTTANGQPAFCVSLTSPDGAHATPASVMVLTITPDGIAGLTNFLDPRLPPIFERRSPEIRF